MSEDLLPQIKKPVDLVIIHLCNEMVSVVGDGTTSEAIDTYTRMCRAGVIGADVDPLIPEDEKKELYETPMHVVAVSWFHDKFVVNSGQFKCPHDADYKKSNFA